MLLKPEETALFCLPLPPGGLSGAEGPLPLQSVQLRGTITGLSASLTFTQTFRNDQATAIEAIYTFPLPDHFAVAGLVARLGDREITARIAEREEARTDYATALSEGRRAALLEQEQGDIFTAQLGNIAPGEEARVTLSLAGRLGIDSGAATFRFPLVVGDRYIPGSELVVEPRGTTPLNPRSGQQPRGTTPLNPRSGQQPRGTTPLNPRISPPRLPGRTGVALDVSVRVIGAGILTGTPRATENVVVRDGNTTGSEHHADWTLTAAEGADLDRDLVVRLDLVEHKSATMLLATDSDDKTQGTWQVTVTPPARTAADQRRSVVLAIDHSGSMSGWKIVAARRAAARIVDSLGADDNFAVVGFDHELTHPPRQDALTPATDRNRFTAVSWLSQMEGRGGTELAQPLARAAELLADAPGERVLVLLTDGQVGNEAGILKLMADRLTGIRVYALGVDRAVNATFLRRLAAVGGGRCDLVESEDELDEVLRRLHHRIAPPAATGLTVAAEGIHLERAATTPLLADLFPAGPTVIQGRWRARAAIGPDAVKVQVLAEGTDGVSEWPAPVTHVTDPVDALRHTWARARLDALQDRWDTQGSQTTQAEIVELSLAHGVLSPFTAWLAVGPGGVTGPLQQVTQAVAQPSGWGGAPPSALRKAAPAMIRTSFHTPMAPEARPVAPMTAPPSPQSSVMMPQLDLTPFTDRVQALLKHFASGESGWEQERDELLDDLRSVDAPQEVLRAIADLQTTAHHSTQEVVAAVRKLWQRHTGVRLD